MMVQRLSQCDSLSSPTRTPSAEAKLHLAWLRDDVVRWHQSLGDIDSLSAMIQEGTAAVDGSAVKLQQAEARMEQLAAQAEYASKAALQAASMAEDERTAHQALMNQYLEVGGLFCLGRAECVGECVTECGAGSSKCS